MNIEALIPLLQINKPEELFRKIVTFNSLEDNPSRKAAIRVGLSSGFEMEGIPLKFDTKGNTVFISSNGSVGYMNINSLAAIEVLNPEFLTDLLTDGDFFEIASDEIPTNLQLKRNFKSHQESFKSDYQIQLKSELLETGTLTEIEKYQLNTFFTMLKEILGVINEDSIGNEALNELDTLEITASEELFSVTRNDSQLNIGISLKKKFSIDLKDKLKFVFETKL